MNYKTYDDDFKREAIRRVIANGEGLRQTSRDLGVKHSTLLYWVDAARKEAKANPVPEELRSKDEEIRGLRKRIKDLEEENLILKKFAHIFAKDLK